MVRSRFNRKLFRGAAALTAASAASQFLPLLTQPYLGRLIPPDAFAPYAVFTSLLSILGQGACLRYDYAALVVPAGDDAEKAAGAAAIACGVLSAAAGLVFWLAAYPIAGVLGLEDPAVLQWVAPALFLTGLGSAFRTYAVRKEKFRFTAWADLGRAAVLSGVQVWGGFAGWGAGGLLAGSLAALVVGALPFMGSYIRACGSKLWKLSFWREIGRTARRLKDFPLYLLPGAVAAGMACSVLPLASSALFEAQKASLAQRGVTLLSIPSSIVSSSFSQVVMKKAVDDRNQGGTLLPWFYKITGMLALVGIVPFAVLFFYGEPLVTWFLGDNWRGLGQVLPYMVPLFAVRFVVIPLTGIPAACGDRKKTMMFQIMLPLAILLAGIGARLLGWGFGVFLGACSVLQSGVYVAFWLYSRYKAKGGAK